MLNPYITGTVVYASLFGLMALGLTLTYITTKVPNFAYGSFVTIGMYTGYTLFEFQQFSPYLSAPVGFVIGGIVSVAMYLGILRTLARRGSSLVALMIATLAIDIAFVGVFGIYTDYLYYAYPLKFAGAKYFVQLSNDFFLFQQPGVFFTAPISLAIITFSLFLLLTKTKFGVAMRASIENPSLARVLGINVEKAYVFAWFLAGGLGGLSGSYYILWLPGGIDQGSNLIVEIFAASVLGGLASIYGAVVGGLMIGASEILVTAAGINVLGSWFSNYQKGIPLVIMVITLLVAPRGLVSMKPPRVLVKFFGRWAMAFRLLYGRWVTVFRRLVRRIGMKVWK